MALAVLIFSEGFASNALECIPTGFLDLPTALRAHVCFSDMRRINLAKLSATGLPCCTHYRGVGSILDLSG
jgi:hypothetical protein